MTEMNTGRVKMSSGHALAAALLLFLLGAQLKKVTAWEDKDFFSYCPPSRCSEHGPEIRFPFQLESNNTTPSSCGLPCMKLSCYGQDTILDNKYLGRPYKVIAIDYRHITLTISPLAVAALEYSSSCPLLKSVPIPSVQFPAVPLPSVPFPYYRHFENWTSCDIYEWEPAALVSCSSQFEPATIPDAADYIAGPISCLSNTSHFSYLVAYDVPTFLIPLDCEVVSDGRIPIPRFSYGGVYKFRECADRVLSFSETTTTWTFLGNAVAFNCSWQCEFQGRRCAFSSQRNQTFCMRPELEAEMNTRIIQLHGHGCTCRKLLKKQGLPAITDVIFQLSAAAVQGSRVKVIAGFSEVKKIARRFKAKVGQGGHGSVYRGELPNGVPVAVKMLENSEGEGDEFINEVATIGRIHHANIVRLLGFCSEGTRRALIYEYMPNDSLEKYIFSHDSNTSQELLVPNKMLDIALGIARGMECLHQGCNQRILHFDIKPNNILLDYNFSPKISDFGLAKLCARDQSIVTLTAARGTMGYIAPELYSRNFGEISYKSDVYSFGMLVLEMVSGKRNSDTSVESQNEVYFPEWIYEQVTTGQDLALGREMTQEEKATMRQLAIVALWCIQWNPKNRPSMTKVVNMLTGRLQNLQMPPKPFFSANSHPKL
uniref:Protein kinase domain-containing protein n=1 Tax=Oryza nivara TaxID=4536 RepID=A0A0E0FFD4_ORYNI